MLWSETFAEGNEMFGMQPHAFYSSGHQSDLLRKASMVLKVFFPTLPTPFFFLVSLFPTSVYFLFLVIRCGMCSFCSGN